MRSNYKPLGKYISLVEERNIKLEDLPLMGLSVSKVFFPTIANLVGTDMSTYKIVSKNQFTYIADTSRRGDKIAIALSEDFDKMLVSQAYTPFEVKDTEKLLPEYLMMWFRRPEFDRYARFMSHGSAREIFGWDEMCNTLLPVPSPAKQKEIVKEYNTIINRINLNKQLIQKLEETAQAIYKHWFVDFEFPDEDEKPYKSSGGEMVESELGEIPKGWEVGTLKDVLNYSNNRISVSKLNLDTYISTENMKQNRGGIYQAANLPSASTVTKFDIGEILISNIRPYFKKIWMADFTGGCSNDVLCFTPKKDISSMFIYYILEKDIFFDYVMAGSKGTKMPRGEKNWILKYPVVIPENSILKNFTKLTTKSFSMATGLKKENKFLESFSELLLSKLATIEK
ncbi:MAG TPA: restriction endonuclease subunit S [Ferruginibacter sp.]|nr:restriction endonuclease subunit S [Ferruginibacter sp.]